MEDSEEIFIVTNCCGEPYNEDFDICRGCGEHSCPAYYDSEGKELSEKQYNELRYPNIYENRILQSKIL